MAANGTRTFDDGWRDLGLPWRRSLELAFEALTAKGLPVGSVMTDETGRIVAEGRNHAYDPPGGRDILQGTPLAHAELNVLAAVQTERDLGPCTLWSTQEPCSMCTGAATFTGVGTIRYLAPDPWANAVGALGAASVDRDGSPRVFGPGDDVWVVGANVLFLLGIAGRSGLEHPTLIRNRELEPETAQLVGAIFGTGPNVAELTPVPMASDFLATYWQRIAEAADARTVRSGLRRGGES